MNHSKKLLSLGQIAARQFSRSAVQQNKAARLKEIQKKFGVDDNVPVYLKGGFGDKVLYQTTWALLIVGLGMSLETFYRLTFGKKA